MKNWKTLLPAIAAIAAVVGFGAYATTKAFAAFGGPSDEQRTQHASELAEKLGVDADKVAQAMEELRQEHQQERQELVSSKLDEAVEGGVITAKQKQLILDKQEELRQERGQKRQEMQDWYTENGIDFDAVHNYIGFGGGMGGGHSRGL